MLTHICFIIFLDIYIDISNNFFALFHTLLYFSKKKKKSNITNTRTLALFSPSIFFALVFRLPLFSFDNNLSSLSHSCFYSLFIFFFLMVYTFLRIPVVFLMKRKKITIFFTVLFLFYSPFSILLPCLFRSFSFMTFVFLLFFYYTTPLLLQFFPSWKKFFHHLYGWLVRFFLIRFFIYSS